MTDHAQAQASLDDVVRNYLQWLKDPSQFVDVDKVTDLEDDLELEKDQLARLRLRAAIRLAEQPPDLTPGFIRIAKQWADGNGISHEDFLAEGVPVEVLKKAKLLPRERKEESSSRPRRSAAAVLNAIRAFVRDKGEAVTVKEVAEALGVHNTTVRDHLKALVDLGEVKEDGMIRPEGAPRQSTAYVWSGH